MAQLNPSPGAALAVTPTLEKTSLSPACADEAQAFVCRRTDNIFVAIEKCLDNGLGVCLVVDDDDRLIGRITLDEIRRAVREGAVLTDTNLDRYVILDPANARRKRGAAVIAVGNDVVLRPIIDGSGRLIDVAVDQSKQFIQVAKPDLSHREFRAIIDAFLSSWISSKGSCVPQFEARFAEYMGMRNAIAVCNGTAALHLALLALSVSPGDEVIVPDLTFAATINAVLYCGAIPVIADIDATTWTLTVEQVARVMTPRTKAIVPVHLYGRPAEIGPLVDFARQHGCAVVEDCCEALGARYAGSLVGTFGDVACFSFYANKVITTGEGGICVTNSQSSARSMMELRNQGLTNEHAYWHDRVGYNYRMTNLQAAMGSAQVGQIDRVLKRNGRLEQIYRDSLGTIPGVTFPASLPPPYGAVTWLACVQVPAAARARLIDCARLADIEIRPFFYPLSAMPAYARYARPCRNSTALAQVGVNLPTSSAVDGNVVEKIRGVFLEVLG